MSLELLCNTNTTLKVKLVAPPITGAVITITASSLKSIKVRAEGELLFHTIFFTVTGAIQGACTGAMGGGIITGASTKCKGSGFPYVKADQEVTITLTGVMGASACSYPATIQIDSPGQTKVRGE